MSFLTENLYKKSRLIVILLAALVVFQTASADSQDPKAQHSRCLQFYLSMRSGMDFALFRGPEKRQEKREERTEWALNTVDKIRTYWKEVKASKGLRILFHKERPETPEDRQFRLGGILGQHEKANSWVDALKYLNPWDIVINRPVRYVTSKFMDHPYNVTPFKFVERFFVRSPTLWLTGKTMKNRYEPAFPVKMGVDFALLYLLFKNVIDPVTDDQKEKRIKADLHGKRANEYDEMVESDIRFWLAKRIRDEGGPDAAKNSREAAYRINKAMQALITFYRSEKKDLSPEELRTIYLVNLELAAPQLVELIKEGVVPNEGFEIPKESMGPLSNQKIDKLIELQIQSLESMEIAKAMIKKNHEFTDAVQKHPEAGKALKAIKEDPQVQFLMELKDQGELTESQLLFEVQTHINWKTAFEVHKVLGIKQLNDEGKPLDIVQIQMMALKDIAEKSTKK